MHRKELIEGIAKEAGISKADAGRNLDATLKVITSALNAGDNVALLGFGTFSVADRAARKGRNPQTGAEVEISAKRVPTFKAGTDLKTAVNS